MKHSSLMLNAKAALVILMAFAVGAFQPQVGLSATVHAKATAKTCARAKTRAQSVARAKAKAAQDRELLLDGVAGQGVLNTILSTQAEQNAQDKTTIRSLTRSLVKAVSELNPNGGTLESEKFDGALGKDAANRLAGVKSITRNGSEYSIAFKEVDHAFATPAKLLGQDVFVLTRMVHTFKDHVSVETDKGSLTFPNPLTVKLTPGQGDNIHVSLKDVILTSKKYGVSAPIQMFDIRFDDIEFQKDNCDFEVMVHGKTTPVAVEVRLDPYGNLRNLTQADMNMTAGEEAQETNADLLVDVEAVRKRLSGPRLTKMLAAFNKSQAVWERYRQAHAEFIEGGREGGSMAPMEFAGAYGQVTQERVQQLEELLSEEEGGTLPPAQQ